MLIGAHVSPAGGPAKAVARGTERACRAIQIFNQSPRMWRPTKYTDEDFAEFREVMDSSRVEAVAEVLPQGAAAHHVEQLHSAAHPENRQVGVERRDPREVAAAWLSARGLVS